MRASRYPVLIAFASALSLVATALSAQPAQTFPTKPVRLVAGAFGSPSDQLARTLAPKLSEAWSKPVVVDNRTGGAGTVQAAIVAQATPDGHTLLLISAQFAIGAALRPKSLPYDALKDFSGVAQLGFSTSTLNVSPTLGVKTLKDFVALARATPGKLIFSSGGGGSSTHISAERFNLAAGITAKHVGFKGTPDALLEVVAQRVQYCLVGLGSAMPFIKDGRLLALAVSTPKRSPLLPDVPAIVELYPTYGTEGAHAIFAPAKTPIAVRERISRDVGNALSSPEVQARLHDLGYNIAPSTPAEHDRLFREHINSFEEIGKRLGLIER